MELPNLLNKLKSTAQETKKFIAIEIGASTVKTAIWQSTGSHTEVISTGSIQSWEGEEDTDLITAIDTSLADAQGSMEKEPDQVIFGLPKSWVDDQGIVSAKKTTLNNVRKKLALKPIGFVVTIEAIAHHLRDVEGGPPSAIIVQLAAKEIAISVIYLGKLEGTQHIERSTSIASDVEEGLLRIPHSGNLPSRIIVMADNDDIEPIKQELISHEWQKKVSFLHFPKVESLSKEWSIKAVAIAGGGEVVESLGFANIESSSKEVAPAAKREPIPEENQPPIKQSLQDDNPPESEPNVEPIPPSQSSAEIKPKHEGSNSLGFKPVNFDASQSVVEEINQAVLNSETDFAQENDNLESASVEEEKPLLIASHPSLPQKQVTPPKNPISNRFKAIFANLKGIIKKPSKKWFIPSIIIIIIIILGGGGAYAYYTIPSAIVEVYVNTSPYTQEINFTLDPSLEESDLTANLIAAKKLSITETGTKTIPTTGTRLIGDRAKGKIALYNRTSAPKSFQAGSVIKTDTLRFTLDTAVTVASASTKENADFSTTTEPSKIEVAVTASDIGEQYNVAKDTQFAIENFSKDSFFAVALDTFRGGSAKKVAAVAAADIQSVQAELIKELQQKISQSESTEEGLGQQQLTISEPTLSQEEYSALQGEEASELSLSATISQDIYQYSGSDVSILAETAAAISLSETQQVKPEQTSISIVGQPVPDETTGQIAVKATVTLQHYEKIDSQLVAQALKGVSLNQLDSALNGKVSGLNSVNLKEGKYLIFNTLPMTAKQISVRIKSVAGNSSQ